MATIVDEYWNRPLVEVGRLPLGIESEQDVFLIWHAAREECGREHRELGLGVMRATDNELITRDYIHCKACYFVPDLVLTLAITDPNAKPGEQLGTIEDVHSRGSRRVEFAGLQAWFYPAVRALVLWEVDLWRGAEADPREDFILAVLFDSFERELLKVFPEAREVIAVDEPKYEHAHFAQFLHERGYEEWRERTFIKRLKREGKPSNE
jgi:hypothetical protein